MNRFALVCSLWMAMGTVAQAQSTPNRTGVFYNANEAGYGLLIEQNGNTLVPAWYTYDTDGKPLWFLVSGAALQSDGSYAGDLYRYTGTPFSQIAGSAVNTSTRVGNAKLRFSSEDQLSFEYTVNGQTQTKSLQKLSLEAGTKLSCNAATGSRANATNFTDMWWNASQSGWGMNIIHQGNSVFVTWYTYGANGQSMWVTGIASRQADGRFRGDLYRPVNGTPFNQINGSAATTFPVPTVGNFELNFSNGENGTFNYTLDGVSQSKSIARFVFGSETTVCATVPSNSGGTGGTFNVGQCARNYINNEEWRVRTDGVETRFKFVGDGTYNGTAVKVVESYDAQNRLTAKSYYRFNGTTIETVGSEGFDPATGALTTRSRFNPFVGFEHNFDIGYSKTIQYQVTTESISPASTVVSNLTQTMRAFARENVTVPAGTFNNACKIDITTTGTSTVQGFTVPIPAITVTSWTAGAAPTAVKTVTPVPINGTSATAELVSFTPGN